MGGLVTACLPKGRFSRSGTLPERPVFDCIRALRAASRFLEGNLGASFRPIRGLAEILPENQRGGSASGKLAGMAIARITVVTVLRIARARC